MSFAPLFALYLAGALEPQLPAWVQTEPTLGPVEEVDAPLSVQALYLVDFLANVKGGRNRTTAALGNFALAIDADLSRLGWSRTRLHFLGLANSGAAFSEDVGDLQVSSNLEAPEAARVFEAWAEHSFSRFSVLAGLYGFDSEFGLLPAASLFTHSSPGVEAAYGNAGPGGPSIFPVSSLALRGEWRDESERLSARLAIADGVPGDPGDLTSNEIDLNAEDGALITAEIAWSYERDGKCFLGAWTFTSDEFGEQESEGPSGIYLGLQRRWNESSVLYAQLGFTDEHATLVRSYIGGGIVFQSSTLGREQDRFGLAFAYARLGDPTASQPALANFELALEGTYRAQLDERWFVQPLIQHIMNPGTDRDLEDATILGLRIGLEF